MKYVPSGRLSIIGALCTLGAAFILPVTVAISYITLSWYLPDMYVRFLFSAGAVVLIGYLMGLLISKGKIRNLTFALFAGLVAATVFTYVQWAMYVAFFASNAIHVTSGNDMRTLAFDNSKFSIDLFLFLLGHPAHIWAAVVELARTGAWTVFVFTPHGFLLWLIWISEILMALAIPFWMCYKAELPYSEINNTWMEEKTYSCRFAIPENVEAVIEKVKQGEADALLLLPLTTNEFAPYLTITTYGNVNDEPVYISVKKNTDTKDDKGKVSTSSDTLLTYWGVLPNTNPALQKLLAGA